MFGKYGRITDVYIPLDYYTRESRGFAYVQYPFLYVVTCYSSSFFLSLSFFDIIRNNWIISLYFW